MMDGKAESESQQTFASLRPLCTRLLDVSFSSTEDRSAVLDSLQRVLKNAPSTGLQRCTDYALFPLVLLLDAAVAYRSSNSSTKLHESGKNQMVLIGDRIAEGVLSCVEIILQRCFLETSAQVTMLLRKLTAAAMLTAAQAAEEFRHGVVKCLQALLQNLRQCDNATCICKSTFSSPFLELAQNPVKFFKERGCESNKLEEHTEVVNACPLGCLQAESMSPAIGHLISLLLQIAEAEVTRGAVGSGKLRRDALFTLRILVLKVGTADGLAFFLPGVASGLTKVMRFSRAKKLDFQSSFPNAIVHTSGAAGWPAAVEEAIRGLTEILVIVLGDERNATALEVQSSAVQVETVTLNKEEHVTASAALATLEGLSMQLHNSVKMHLPSGEAAGLESESKSKSLAIIARGKQQATRTSFLDHAAEGVVSLPLRSERNKEWLDLTASRLESLFSQTFPLLCAHQSPSVRIAVSEAGAILLARCGATLRICTSIFMESLLALACDDWEHVASAAQTYLTLLLAPSENMKVSRISVVRSVQEYKQVQDIKLLHSVLASILSSMLDQLPRVVFSADTSMSVLHARRLVSAMYFLGPDGVSLHILENMVAKRKFVQALIQCLSFNVTFTGSLEQIVSSKSTIYGSIVSEVKSIGQNDDLDKSGEKQTGTIIRLVQQGIEIEELPTMPPWLSLGTGSSKLYRVLAHILRLAGLSAVTDHSRGTSLVGLIELLLQNIRRAASNNSSYTSDTTSEEIIGGGQVQRMAATSACVLNEIIYGASGAWNDKLFTEFGDHMLGKNLQKQATKSVFDIDGQLSTIEQENSSQKTNFQGPEGLCFFQSLQGRWQAAKQDEVINVLNECAGDILHDFLATEVWDQPTDLYSATFGNKLAMGNLKPAHVFQDNAMLQKVLVEGVGVLGIALGKTFEENGFLGLVLFPLLEKLACLNYLVHHAAAVSLKTLCSHCHYGSVRDLVVANVDSVIDSLCRQFRHLTMYPNAPNLLAAILRHTNSSADLLPLLEEPLRGVVLELEVLARRDHPHFTVPLLRALREITRASRVEAGVMLSKAVNASVHCKSLLEKESGRKAERERELGEFIVDSDLEELVNQFIDRRSSRRAVAAIATSCLSACGPLLASKNPQPCLLALDTVEDGVAALSHAEEAGVHESQEKDYMEQLCKVIGYVQACEDLTSVNGKYENESRKLLPIMNRVWPHLVLCLQHAHTSVIVRAMAVIASATVECGGDFFTRRFAKDALPMIVKLLRGDGLSTFQRKKFKSPGLMPLSYDSGSQEPLALAAVLKVQHAVLKGIAAIADSKRSVSALAGSFSVVADWVVLLACCVESLREVATATVLALSTIDPDLVWIPVIDLVYSPPKQEFKGVTPAGFPSFYMIFPAC